MPLPFNVLNSAWPVPLEWLSLLALFWLVGWTGWQLGHYVGLRRGDRKGRGGDPHRDQHSDLRSGLHREKRAAGLADLHRSTVLASPATARPLPLPTNGLSLEGFHTNLHTSLAGQQLEPTAPDDTAWLDRLPQPAALLSEQHEVQALNAAAQRLFSTCDAAHLRAALAPLLALGATEVHRELTLDHCGGLTLMLDVSARRLERPTEHGVPTPQWVVLLRDISEAVHQRQVADSHRQRLLQTLDATGMAVWEWDIERQRFYSSARGWRLTYGERPLPNAMPTVLTLEDFWASIHPEDVARVRQLLLEGVQHHDTFEYRCRTVGYHTIGAGPEALKAKAPVWVHSWAQVQRDAQGQATTVRGLMRDVTMDQQQAGLAERSRLELQRLSARLLQAREEERQHIARELHDELGQRLSLLKIHLSKLLDDVAQASVLQVVADPLEEALDETDELIRALRRIAADLRPPMLDDLGLVEAIRWLVNDSAERLNLSVRLALDDPGELPPPTAIAVFRMVQEAITNAHRHAQAQTLEVTLQVQPEALVVTARDDGVGYAPPGDGCASPNGVNTPSGTTAAPGISSPAHNGWGLIGIRERAALLGGHFEIRRLVAGGTELRLWVPRPAVPAWPAEAATA